MENGCKMTSLHETKQYTLCIIKPDAVQNNFVGAINERLKIHGFDIGQSKMMLLTADEVREFYKEHRNKSFFEGLVKFMSSGECVVQVLRGFDAIQRYRSLMGVKNLFILY